MPKPALPGDIPGLLQLGSPVVLSGPVFAGQQAIVFDLDLDPNGKEGPRVHVARYPVAGWPDQHVWRSWAGLDLSLPLGRLHAAWWAGDQPAGSLPGFVTTDVADYPAAALLGLLDKAQRKGPFTDDEIEALRIACLAAAGRLR